MSLAASCSAVLSLFTTFGYFGGVRAHDPVVREVARVLAPGGHWFLDFLDSERVAAAEREAVTARKLPGRKYGPEEFARTMGRGYTEWLS